MSVRVTLLGTGNAFSHGGRFQSCFLVEHDGARILMDCGGTAPVALKRAGLGIHDPDAILVSHFHGDHFGGVPYLLVDMRIHGRTRPLVLAGPPGVEARVREVTDALYRGAGGQTLPFPLEVREYGRATGNEDASGDASAQGATPPVELPGGALLHAFRVPHSEAAEPHALRLEVGGRVVAYSGDSEWTETLLQVASEADLFLCECSGMAPVPSHLDYPTLLSRRADLTCRRLLLTHMGEDVLERCRELELECSRDGLVVDL